MTALTKKSSFGLNALSFAAGGIVGTVLSVASVALLLTQTNFPFVENITPHARYVNAYYAGFAANFTTAMLGMTYSSRKQSAALVSFFAGMWTLPIFYAGYARPMGGNETPDSNFLFSTLLAPA